MNPRYLAVAVLVSLLTSAGAMLVVFHLADRQIRAERMAREEQQAAAVRQSEAGKQVTCAVIAAQVDVYRDTPPSTATGKNAAQAWHDLSIQLHC